MRHEAAAVGAKLSAVLPRRGLEQLMPDQPWDEAVSAVNALVKRIGEVLREPKSLARAESAVTANIRTRER